MPSSQPPAAPPPVPVARQPVPAGAPAPQRPSGPLLPLGPVKLDPAKAPPRMPISELRVDRVATAAPAAQPGEQPATEPLTPPPAAPDQPLVQLAMEIFNAKIVDVRKKE